MRREPSGWWLVLLASVMACASPAGGEQDEAGRLLARLQAVGPQGAGNAEAATAWARLVGLGPFVLPRILHAIDDADPVAANWLRAAFDTIASREQSAGRPIPAKELEEYIRQTCHSGRARRLAYEWLVRTDASAPARLLPGMLHDPSAELRRDAVDLVLADAQRRLDRDDRPGAAGVYRKALSGALDCDQVALIAGRLKALGTEVDLAGHFGFLRHGMILGPFDNTAGAGFDRAFAPERGVDLSRTYRGKGGARLRWAEYTSHDAYGLVDLNKVVGRHRGAVAYAFAVVSSAESRAVQVRAGSENAIKVFLNGRPLFGREEYHHGMGMDQHIAAGRLRAGRNELLLKLCQNEQTEDWAGAWSFQVRLTDASGEKVPLEVGKEGGR
jgi:hypothetical protein